MSIAKDAEIAMIGLIGRLSNIFFLRQFMLHATSKAASGGPNMCISKECIISPLSAAAVARVKKQPGHGIPVAAKMGHVNPGSSGCLPLSHR